MSIDSLLQVRIRNVKDLLLDFSDADYQHRAWFIGKEELDSPGDMYHALFGSQNFDEFIESTEINLNEKQQTICRRLRDALREFQPEVIKDPDPRRTYNHPKWIEIRSLAADALAAMAPGS